MTGVSSADAVTQGKLSSLQAGLGGERRDTVTSLLRKHGPLGENSPKSMEWFSCDAVQSLVSNCNTWGTHCPKAIP